MSLSLTIFGYPGNLSKLHITAYLLISIGIFAVHLHDFHLRSSPQTLVFTKVASAEALQSRDGFGVFIHSVPPCSSTFRLNPSSVYRLFTSRSVVMS